MAEMDGGRRVTDDVMMRVSHVDLCVHESGMPHSFYTLAGSVLVLETYEAAWGGREIAWRTQYDESEA